MTTTKPGKPAEPKLTLYPYIRFSTTEQRHGSSPERQAEMLKDLAERHGWDTDTTLNISDLGRSAYHEVEFRKGLMTFIKAVEDGTVKPGLSALGVERLDRLDRRELIESMDLLQWLLKHEIAIATAAPERVYRREDLRSIGAWMEILIMQSVAFEESEKKSGRTKDNHEKKRKKGDKTGKCPAWIDFDDDGQPYLNKAKAAAIHQIYEWAMQGFGNRVITKKLNQAGIPNIAIGYKKTACPFWNGSYVRLLLNCRAVIGEHQHCIMEGKTKRKPIGEPIKDYWPAVIDEDTFYHVKALQAGRFRPRGKAGRRTANIFLGIIFDSVSGSSMRIINSSMNDKRKGIMRRLANYHATEGADHFHSWPYEAFENAFLDALKSEITTGKLFPSTKQKSNLPALAERLAELDGQIDSLQTRLVDGHNFDAGLSLLEKLDARKRELLAEIESEKQSAKTNETEILSNTVSVIEAIRSAPDDQQEEIRDRLSTLVHQLVQRITVTISDIDGNKMRKRLSVGVSLKGRKVWFHFGQESWKGIVNKQFGHRYSTGGELAADPKRSRKPNRASA